MYPALRRSLYIFIAIAAFSLIVFVGQTGLAQVSATVTNSSFELPTTSTSTSTVQSWAGTGATVNLSTISSLFTNPSAFSGSQVVRVTGGNADITQVTPLVVAQPGGVYTLRVTTGSANNSTSSKGYSLEFMIDMTRVASQSFTIPAGTVREDVFSWTAPSDVLHQALKIRLRNAVFTGQTYFDNVRFTIPADTTRPTATLQSPQIVEGATSLNLRINYADNVAVDATSIGTGDIIVTGPRSFSQTLPLISTGLVNSALVRPFYRITPPGGSWDISDNGTYTVALQANQIKDTSNNFALAKTLGTFTVNLADTAPPTAILSNAPNVSTAGGTDHTFTVTYTDNIAINVATLDSNDIQVTGANSFSQAARFVTVNLSSNGTPRTATYSITAPGGTWDVKDNGTYTVALQANQVQDTSNIAAAAAALGSFTVDVPAPASQSYSSERCAVTEYSGTRSLQLVRDRQNRLYMLGLLCGDRVQVAYTGRPHRVRIRPNACGLLQFWRATRFNPYLNNRLTIYLAPPYEHSTVEITPNSVASAPTDSQPCSGTQVNESLPWQTLSSGVRAVQIVNTSWVRNVAYPRDTQMLFVDGLAAQANLQIGSFLEATNHTAHVRFAWSNQCGMVRFVNNRTFDNVRHLAVNPYWYLNGSSQGYFNFASLPLRPALTCRGGVLYNTETRQPY